MALIYPWRRHIELHSISVKCAMKIKGISGGLNTLKTISKNQQPITSLAAEEIQYYASIGARQSSAPEVPAVV
ncbi:hypothetical protein DJ56_3508 [Yersinia pestis]|nr:hypothetical protein DJ56_3508 [Yersinia pestis]